MQRAHGSFGNTPSAQQHNPQEIQVLQPTSILDGGTTRRFPRTLDQAFGCDGYYITHYRNRWSWVNRTAVFALWVLAVAWGTTLWI
jgi:hypothetical protein